VRPVVALDTNILLVPFQFGVDIFEEIQRLVPGARLVVLKGTLRELDKIANQGTKEKKWVALVKKLLEKHHVEILPKDGPVDRKLAELAKSGVIIATNDRELKNKVWSAGGKVISLREKNRLELF
jgi:rRNA-processing protein FCF1